MIEWKKQDVKVTFIQAPTLGFMAITTDFNCPENYVITHIGTGYCLPYEKMGIPTDLIECKRAAEFIVNNHPECDDFFTRMVEGTLENKEIKDMFKKLCQTIWESRQ